MTGFWAQIGHFDHPRRFAVRLFEYIGNQTSTRITERYVEAILSFCGQLKTFPLRGAAPLAMIFVLGSEQFAIKKVLIAYTVEETQVFILGIYHGGQDYEALIRDLDHEDQ